MKLNLKQLNVMQFLGSKGDKIALGLSVLVMVSMLLTGVILQYFGGGSESTNADAIAKLTQQGESAFRSSMPTDDVGKVPQDLLKGVNLESVDPALFPTVNPFFTLSSLDDNKWRIPEVLAPDEFQVDLVQGLVRSYLLSPKGDAIAVLVPKDKKPENPNGQPNSQQPASKLLRPGMGGPGVGGPGVGGPGVTLPPRPTLPTGPSIIAGNENGERSKAEFETKYVPIAQFGSKDDTVRGKAAESVRPFRIATIMAAFPYQAQLEEFRRALRAQSVAAMMDDKEAVVEFLGVNVQRREILPDGSIKDGAKNDGWRDFDAKKNYLSVWRESIGTLPEDADYQSLGVVWANDRLVLPRLKLARGQEYPAVTLKGINETVAAMKRDLEGGTVKTIAPPKTKLKEDDDLFQTEPPEKNEAGRPVGAPPPAFDPGFRDRPPPAAGTLRNDRRAIPEKCLVRFYDFSVQPGSTYQYRVQVQMANPLFGKEDLAVAKNLTEKKEINGVWSAPTSKLEVPRGLHFYVVDEKPDPVAPKPGVFTPPVKLPTPNANQVVMQAHKWVDWVALNPATKGSETAVGDWTVCQRFLATRGDFVGMFLETDIPVWWPTLEEFVMAVREEDRPRWDARSRKWIFPPKRAIPVDFNDHTGRAPLLVDFRGGKSLEIIKKPDGKSEKLEDESPLEVLFLMPDGKLAVRNNRVDANDEKRTSRVEAWKTWLNAVRDRVAKIEGGTKPSGSGGLFDKPEGER